jgi:selenocysteine lyase/cysteine desulfurase
MAAPLWRSAISMTHEYVIAVGGTILHGDPAKGPATAVAWAVDRILAIASDDSVTSISRGDSTFIDIRGCAVTRAPRDPSLAEHVLRAAVAEGRPFRTGALLTHAGLLEADQVLEPGSPADLAFWSVDPEVLRSESADSLRIVAVVRDGAFTTGDEHRGPFAEAPRRSPDPALLGLFEPAAGLAYLDAATYGLPPTPTFQAMERALKAWRAGTGRWVDDWDRPTDSARGGFAALIGAEAGDIALIPSASVGMGLVANALGPGDVVVVPEDEHVSDLFPLLVAERRGVTVRQVPFTTVASAIDDSTTLVAFSLVQMQTGRIADLAGICRRARTVGARVFVDSTHGTPFVSVADHIRDIDFLVCHAYKHLLGSRGTAFLYVRKDRLDDLTPTYANWRGAADPWSTFFGGPLSLADDASRFNVSLAWLPWVGTRESVRLLLQWWQAGALAEPLALAAQLARAVGIVPSGSSLVCVPVTDAEGARAALDAARVKAAVRGDAIRFSLHVWNTGEDVERAAAAIAPYLRPD